MSKTCLQLNEEYDDKTSFLENKEVDTYDWEMIKTKYTIWSKYCLYLYMVDMKDITPKWRMGKVRVHALSERLKENQLKSE